MTLHDYAAARDAGDWAAACELMSPELRAEIRARRPAKSQDDPFTLVREYRQMSLPA